MNNDSLELAVLKLIESADSKMAENKNFKLLKKAYNNLLKERKKRKKQEKENWQKAFEKARILDGEGRFSLKKNG